MSIPLAGDESLCSLADLPIAATAGPGLIGEHRRRERYRLIGATALRTAQVTFIASGAAGGHHVVLQLLRRGLIALAVVDGNLRPV